jgi:hypothetical protein
MTLKDDVLSELSGFQRVQRFEEFDLKGDA